MWKVIQKDSPNDKEPFEKEFSTYEDLKNFLVEFDLFRKAMLEHIQKGSTNNGKTSIL